MTIKRIPALPKKINLAAIRRRLKECHQFPLTFSGQAPDDIKDLLAEVELLRKRIRILEGSGR